MKDAVIEDEELSENTPLHQKLETQDSTIEMTESLVPNGQSEMEHEVLSPSVNEMSNEVVEELPIEESEKPSEESETTSPVSIFDMPLVSIVEEDDFVVGGSSDGEESEESEDEPGVSIQFLINSPEPSVSNEEFEQVFESDVTLESPSQEQSASGGFVATLAPDSTVMTGEVLMWKNHADIEFPRSKKCMHKIKLLVMSTHCLILPSLL